MPNVSRNDFAACPIILSSKASTAARSPKNSNQPFAWRRPRRIFVNSMSDLFPRVVPTEYIARVANVM